MRRRVVILQETFPNYRVALFAEICRLARDHDIDVQIIHGQAPGGRGARSGGGNLNSALTVDNRYIQVPLCDKAVVWQPCFRKCLRADLVVVEQATRLLINYLLVAANRMGGPKIAFWGHGRNLQSSQATTAERCKSSMLRLPSWWFAYTSGVAQYLQERGVPASRITVVGNTIDVLALHNSVERRRDRLPPARSSKDKCVFLGGLYSLKRLEFLFDAADLIAKRWARFELHIAGTGEQRQDVEQFAAQRPWVRYWGPVEGEKRASLLASARLVLMPGLVGLVVLDSFAAGIPLVTTADAMHSPEIEYLHDGVNGVIVPPGLGAHGYAAVVVRLLESSSEYATLSAGARKSLGSHTLEAAAERFVEGLSAALIGN